MQTAARRDAISKRRNNLVPILARENGVSLLHILELGLGTLALSDTFIHVLVGMVLFH